MSIDTSKIINLVDELEKQQNSTNNEISNIKNKSIPAAENKLDIVTNEIKSAREYVQSRMASISAGAGGILPGIPSLPLPPLPSEIPTGIPEINDIFKNFNEGDKAIKEQIKDKILIPPQISDAAIQLAGGISAKSFLDSLSSFSLPGLEELDSLKQLAADAQSTLNGELAGLEKSLGGIGSLEAVKSLGDLEKYKEMGKGLIDKANGFIEEGKKLKEQATSKIQEAKDALDKTKKSIESTVQGIKEQAKNLENQAVSLVEQAKNLPEQARGQLLEQANSLISQASQKYEESKKTAEDLVKKADETYKTSSAEAKKLLEKVDELESRPEVLESKAIQQEIANKEAEVESIKSSISPDDIKKLESAVAAKSKLDSAIAKASAIQDFAMKSKQNMEPPIDVKSHVPVEFEPFSEWVLKKENEVYVEPNTESPNRDLRTEAGIKPLLEPNIVPSQYGYLSNTPTPPVSERFIIYRGASGGIKKPTSIDMMNGNFKDFGVERFPTRFRSFCDFGVETDSVVNINKLFEGYVDKIMSPIDIAIILNAGNVGMFNNVVPYGFGVGSELAAPITFQNTRSGKTNGAMFDKGGVGTKRGENWAFQPHWSGLYVNFLLDKNGIYQSDSDFIDFLYAKHMDRLIRDGISYGLKLSNTAPLTDIPKAFPGAVIGYYDKATSQGHTEILLRVALNGFLTLGGNIKLDGTGVGTTHGFRFYSSLKEFSPNHEVLLIRRGTKNGWTVNGRLDGRIKRTPVIDEYMRAIEDKTHHKNRKLLIGAYNLLRNHLSGIVYAREDMSTEITPNFTANITFQDPGLVSEIKRPLLSDSKFTLHTQYDSYINGIHKTPFSVINSKDIEKSSEKEGH